MGWRVTNLPLSLLIFSLALFLLYPSFPLLLLPLWYPQVAGPL